MVYERFYQTLEMCESVEVARILDVSGALLKTTCRQNSALANLSVMAKIRIPEKLEFKKCSALQVNCAPDKRVSPSKMLSSQESTATDLTDIINNVVNLHFANDDVTNKVTVHLTSDDVNEDAPNDIVVKTFSYTCNIISSDDECPAKVSVSPSKEAKKSKIDEAKGLLKRGPIRPQMTPDSRAKPYVDHSGAAGGDVTTDYDTSAKAILRDREYREKIDFCLDQLSDMGQDPGNSLSPTHSDLSVASAYSQSPQPQQQWSPGSRSALTPASSSSCFVPSITVSSTGSSPESGSGAAEHSLLHMLTQGGLQAASGRVPAPSAALTPEYTSGASAACASDNWPDSPTSSYNACANSVSGADSRASSRAQSPGSNTGGGPSFLNILGSLSVSPQVSPQHLRSLQRPSSSSSSSHSYCETPSPANYQNPLEQHVEDQLGDSIMNRLPAWRDNYESTDTLVNSADLQLVEEVIRCDMSVQHQQVHPHQQPQQCQQNQSHQHHQHQQQPQQHQHQQKRQQQQESPTHPRTGGELLQVVPTGTSFGSPNRYQSMTGGVQVIPSPPASYSDVYDIATDDLTNTLLKFVGSDQAVVTHRKVEPRCSSASSQYGYTGGGIVNREVRRAVSESCLPAQQSSTPNFLSKSPSGQQPHTQHQTYQPQCMNFGPSLNVPGIRYPATSGESMGRGTWTNYSEPSGIIENPISSNSFNQFQMPETVATTQHSPASKRSSSRSPPKPEGQRTISPWPSLNLPATSSASRLQKMTKPEEVDRAMKNLLKKPLQTLTACDEDGDTVLMCLVGNSRELEVKLAYLAPLVERLGTIDGALSMLNHQGEDALYLAAMNCPQKAFVAGYLAAAYLEKKIDIGNRLYGQRGNTLIHALALHGDAYGEVLAELLSLTVKEKSVFDLTKRNFDGRTPLHMAVRGHCDPSDSPSRSGAIGTVRLLLENGADPTFRDARDGNTALHMAVSLSCDPSLVKALLTGRGHDAVNVLNYNGNSPLHLAAANSTHTSLERQSEVCWLLIQAGARSNITNRENKTPLALAPADRKEALRRLFHRRL